MIKGVTTFDDILPSRFVKSFNGVVLLWVWTLVGDMLLSWVVASFDDVLIYWVVTSFVDTLL